MFELSRWCAHLDRNYHLRHLDQLVVALWPKKSDEKGISPKRAGPRKHQSKPVQSSFPSTFFHHFLPNPKKQNQQKPIGHWEPSSIFLSMGQPRKTSPPGVQDQKTQVKAKKLQAKAEAEGARKMFLGRGYWPKKPMEKEADAEVEPQQFYFCCRASILRILRKFWKCYEKEME